MTAKKIFATNNTNFHEYSFYKYWCPIRAICGKKTLCLFLPLSLSGKTLHRKRFRQSKLGKMMHGMFMQQLNIFFEIEMPEKRIHRRKTWVAFKH